MISSRNIGFVLIGDTTPYNNASATNPAEVGDGEVVVFDQWGTVVTTGTATAGQKFRVVQGRGSGLSNRSTDLIDPANGNLVSFNANRHYNAAEQVTDLGYNGSTGSIDAQNSTSYLLRINLLEKDKTGFAQQEKIYGKYTSDSSATQWEIAREIAANLNDNARKRKERDVSATCIFDNAAAVDGTSIVGPVNLDEVNVTHGSDIITQGSNAWTAAPVVGEVLSLDSANSVGYEIVEVINSTTVRVHMPYQGATATNQIATAHTAASIAAADCGIKLTGVARGFSASHPGRWAKVSFNTQLENFGNTTLTSTTTPTEGQGNYQQVAKDEYFAEAATGNKYRKDFLFSATTDTDLSGATYYGCLAFKWTSPHVVSGIGNQPVSSKHCHIYVGDGAADSAWSEAGNQGADLRAILNTIFGTSEAYN